MNNLMKIPKEVLVRDRNVIAAVLSIIPGLGHIYEGHYAAGFTVLLLLTPIMIWTGVLLSLATMGFGLLAPVVFWGFVGFDAYFEDDCRKHHLMDVV